ncbi:helix-turn-helix transcriptional regulator [Myceligenerans pegani]|uniref:Helix-turn-helix transcriptional regulator n=1 Tax=Myceligenerans pegani TaxID=2776917 RepID=A0ABR9MUJ6_9MICO|nr:helix-turn-helix transcriptional regulator [Myceligenerans sp. TRM 65318]MBE1875042.1 helix-turn-helix transcriptional regulator [Myceligenerans sp. TRM 65318]MBE3017313.1 helix-turn-helix transcriptional regulator [Myceligenerans sp. TRM 65318]
MHSKDPEQNRLVVDRLPQRLERLIGEPEAKIVIVIVGHEIAAELGLVAPTRVSARSREAGRHSALAQRRLDMGLAQQGLAEEIGVQLSTVGRWERGVTKPSPWARRRLCEVLDVSPDELSVLLDGGGTLPIRVMQVEHTDAGLGPGGHLRAVEVP